jgi:hypothetical protein
VVWRRGPTVTESFGGEDVHGGFEAGAEVEVVGADLEPVVGALVDIEAAADFDGPAVAQADFTVVKAGVLADLKGRVELLEAFGDSGELGEGFVFFVRVVEARYEYDFLRLGELDGGFAEAEEINDLMVGSDVRIFDDDFVGPWQIIPEDGFVRVTGGPVVEPVVALLGSG